MEAVTLRGTGLHAGKPCAVTLRRRPGPVCFLLDGGSAQRDDLDVVRTDRGVCVEWRGRRVDLVEHLCAALGGLSIQRGVSVAVEGSELPLLDGGAVEFCRGLRALSLDPSPPHYEITRAETLKLGDAEYRFEPGAGCRIEVSVDFPGVGPGKAHWNGVPDHFERHVAPAKTFGYASERELLRAAGRAHGVDRRAVVVLDDAGRPLPGFAPLGTGSGADRLACHKLLDLIGDLYLFGGPPLGSLWASRPGHTHNHAAARFALERGVWRELAV